ncbi:alanine--glyoxylate aminotransferase family protein [Mariprofundus erugo]|uniref:pyridoxal-phosphate-dependent aminotransferase family protein n=1 Tax=Mariprofundus erugo TaxID=2528639 RepID=UPI0010FD2194|nr:alanine--glyoxylate aminotransferase family protein [Mariprofundus erugo]TLS76723.1 alanine--glyoxylate aminotransferase family protein [Mariprofundus erugo]
MIKQYLLSPGPTAVPERVMLRMAHPMIHHRTPQFSAVFAETRAMLVQVFQTAHDVLLLSSSGTGAMEASLANLCSPGDTIIYVNGGKFGERWGEIAGKYGVHAVEVKAEWGDAVTVADIKAALAAHPQAKGVFVQASETSTTTDHPIREIAALTAGMDGCVTVVDAITALGVMDMPMDAWGLDVVISASQKAFMLPPGLAMIACSEKYRNIAASARCSRFYFDLETERRNQVKGKDTTAWTPATSLIIGLNEVLKMMLEEGLEQVYARHALMAEATRAGIAALGLGQVSRAPATSATAAYIPESIHGGDFVRFLRDKMGVTFAGGQGQLSGRIVRIAHLGYHDVFDVVTAISALEIALNRFRYPVDMGKGVAAAQAILVGRFPEA